MDPEASQIFQSSFPQGSHPSPDGSLIASVHASRLILQDAGTYEIQRSIQLPMELGNNVSFLKWSPHRTALSSDLGEGESGLETPSPGFRSRFLVADEQLVEAYEVHDENWKAVLSPGLGGIKYCDFGSNEDEVLVLSEFGLKLTIWSLKSPFHVDLQHPKAGSKSFGYRPGTNHLALLTRPAAHDVLNIYSPQHYTVIKSVELPTVDAQGLKWSPDGRWIAIWDSPSAAYRVLLYTANGHMFRTHEQPCVGLGLKTVEWSRGGEYLVLGAYDGSVIFLNTSLQFNKVIEMRHTTEMKQPTTDVWSEELSVHGERHYTLITPPVNLPTVDSPASDPNPKIGVSTALFSANGTLVATKDERMPTSAWIWSLETLAPIAILVQLSQIKAIQWHPSRGDLLAMVCGADPNHVNSSNIPSIYLWCQHWDYPRTIKVSSDLLAANLWLRWIGSEEDMTQPIADEDGGVDDEDSDSKIGARATINWRRVTLKRVVYTLTTRFLQH